MLRQILSLFIILAVLASCSRGGRKGPGGGGVDGGGGDFIYNTKEDVLKAVDLVWKSMKAVSSANPVLVAYYDLKETEKRDPEQEHVFAILSKMVGKIPHLQNLRSFSSAFGTDFDKTTELTTSLKDKSLNLKESGPCNGPGDKHFLASVTKLDLTGEICVSVHGLMRAPSGSLKTDLLALLVHEVAHLNGYGEDDARRVQRYFIQNMDRILRRDGFDARVKAAERVVTKFTSKYPWLFCYDKVVENYCIWGVKNVMSSNFRDWLNSYNMTGPLKAPEDGDDMGVARPDLFGDAFRAKGAAERAIWDLEAAMLKIKGQKVTPELLADIRLAALATLDFEEALLDYYFGDRVPANPNFQSREAREAKRKAIMRATVPAALTDKSLRLEGWNEDRVEELE